MLPPSGRLLAVDWGDVRIGLALSDESQILASPLETLVRRVGKRFPMPRFLELVGEHGPVGVVMGLPLTGEGAEEASAVAAREMADTIGRRTGLPVELWDERMSTARALAAIREQGGSHPRAARGRRRARGRGAAAALHGGAAGGEGGPMTARTPSIATLGMTAAVLASLAGCAGTNSAPERVTVPAGRHLRRRHRHARRPRRHRQPAGLQADRAHPPRGPLGAGRRLRVLAGHAALGGARRPRQGRSGLPEVHGARGTHHPRGGRPRRPAARAAAGLGARRRHRRRRRQRAARLPGAQLRGLSPAGDLHPAARPARGRAGPDHGRSVQVRMGAGLDAPGSTRSE